METVHRDEGRSKNDDEPGKKIEKKKIRAQGHIKRLKGKVQWEGDLETSRRPRV